MGTMYLDNWFHHYTVQQTPVITARHGGLVVMGWSEHEWFPVRFRTRVGLVLVSLTSA